jgi:hypothetical protein
LTYNPDASHLSLELDMAESDDTTLTPDEMRDWLRQEIRDLTKAFELRINDATDFVTSYALGEITATDASNRLSAYQHQWGDSPISGVTVRDSMSNSEILKKQEEALPSAVRALNKRRSSPSSTEL